MLHVRRHILPALLACFLQAGCTPPDAVRKFTATASESARALPPVFKDLPESCTRRQMAERPADEIADVSEEARTACKPLQDVEPKLTAAVKVLSNYLKALNQLASGSIVSFDKEIDGFASNLEGTGAFSDAQAKAAGGLAKFLANAAAGGFQRKKLAEALQNTDKDVKTLCDGLGAIISQDYERVLQNEEGALRSRYRDAIAGDTAHNSASALIIQEYWRRDLAGLDHKRTAAKNAVEMLNKIRDGHHSLAASSGQWNAKELVQAIEPYTDSMQRLFAEYGKVF
jgi:hypothetical protein